MGDPIDAGIKPNTHRGEDPMIRDGSNWFWVRVIAVDTIIYETNLTIFEIERINLNPELVY